MQIYHNKKLDDDIIKKIRAKFSNADNIDRINDILKQLIEIEEAEKKEKNKKLTKIKKIQEKEEKKEAERKAKIKKMIEKRRKERAEFMNDRDRAKFLGTLSQTFKDSNKYKKIDDKDFFNTRNFINDNSNRYYNSAQGFYNPNQMNNYNNYNQQYLNNMNEDNIYNILYNDYIDYNKLEDKEILIRELLNSYKIKLNNELYEFIESEEKKEKERINLYHNTSINQKEDIKIQLAEERVNSTNMINKFIEDNDKKYQIFENDLRKKFNLL